MNIARTMIIYWDVLAHQLKWSLFERRGSYYAGGPNMKHMVTRGTLGQPGRVWMV